MERTDTTSIIAGADKMLALLNDKAQKASEAGDSSTLWAIQGNFDRIAALKVKLLKTKREADAEKLDEFVERIRKLFKEG